MKTSFTVLFPLVLRAALGLSPEQAEEEFARITSAGLLTCSNEELEGRVVWMNRKGASFAMDRRTKIHMAELLYAWRNEWIRARNRPAKRRMWIAKLAAK